MKVTYTPGEGDVQIWDFDPDQVPQSQAEMIERRYGSGPGQWDAWVDDCRRGGARARKILLWHLLRQTHHTLRFEDVPDFRMGQVKVEHSLEELLTIRDRVLKSNLTTDEKDGVLAALDLEITEQMGDDAPPADVEPAEAGSGKALPNSA
ncbi:hypothetical protein ACTOB_001396 [Actinoplanes oblitus]|uniref:Uncharacterized protein n=1 Tax=Actinoplanes oblitus TaxID=3040509 RepID=A0ABY8WLY0_9ACTN|nr:hypothetical protein [Actinoplanes oblitus]WIM97842.1 hypothetical protein ACTOB_001396 [Actinoplanes oblitus]